jgi:hypothetical protein
MDLTVLWPQSEPKSTPRSTKRREIGQHGSWQTIVPFHKQWHVTLYYSVKSHFGTEFLPLDIRKSRGQSNVSLTNNNPGQGVSTAARGVGSSSHCCAGVGSETDLGRLLRDHAREIGEHVEPALSIQHEQMAAV